MFTLRFDMRAPESGAPIVDLYRAAVEMAEWGQNNGCLSTLISEHHSSSDGYLPSPLVLATAIAARTTTMPIIVGALLLNFYDPVKVAEDMIVLDILSRGRVSYVVGLGYRPEEYDMFGVDMPTRGLRMDDNLEVLRRALAGDRFEHAGRNVHVTPAPFSPAGPRLAYGGHSLAAARRAGRLGLDLFAEGGTHALVDAYDKAAAAVGVHPGTAMIPDGSSGTSVFISDDVDRAWLEMGPYLLHDAVAYRQWMGDNHAAASRSEATSIEELRAEHGAYRILTLDDATAQMAAGVPVLLHPLCGGMPPELGWPTVRLAGQAASANRKAEKAP